MKWLKNQYDEARRTRPEDVKWAELYTGYDLSCALRDRGVNQLDGDRYWHASAAGPRLRNNPDYTGCASERVAYARAFRADELWYTLRSLVGKNFTVFDGGPVAVCVSEADHNTTLYNCIGASLIDALAQAILVALARKEKR